MACAARQDYGRAIKELQTVLEFWTNEGDLVMQGKAFCTLGNIYLMNQNWEDATVATLTGLALLEAHPEGQTVTIAIEKSNLAGHYLNTGDFEQALEMFIESARELRSAGRHEQAAQAEMNALGVLHFTGDSARFALLYEGVQQHVSNHPLASLKSKGWWASIAAISAP